MAKGEKLSASLRQQAEAAKGEADRARAEAKAAAVAKDKTLRN